MRCILTHYFPIGPFHFLLLASITELTLPLQAVYGVLNVAEGLNSFQDVMGNTGVGPWYQAVKEEVTQHRGKNRSYAS